MASIWDMLFPGGGQAPQFAGSRNYVVFDPKMIEILRKYGIAGLLSSGAASQLPIPKQQAPVF